MSNSEHFDCDYLVLGSGFGGSVSALRLAEKGYSVTVLERGRRWKAEDFPRTNWNLRKALWAPLAGCRGILRFSLLSDVLVLSGSGVGGGSLVYASTLLEPGASFYDDPQWAGLRDWRSELAPHYAEAARMLGASELPEQYMDGADEALREAAREMGREHTWRKTRVGIYLGEQPEAEQEEELVPDPYFEGRGPERSACIRCGRCMSGCRHRAKNSLDLNYLHLAEQLGVRVLPEREAVWIRPLGGPGARGEEGWEVGLRRVGGPLSLFDRQRPMRARGLVLSAGVLGTLKLLFASKERGFLPDLPAGVGKALRTNGEAIVGATARSTEADFSRSVAITSGAWLDPETHVEVVRYGRGNDLLSVLATHMVDGGGATPRWLRWIAAGVRHPLTFLKTQWPFGWAYRTVILLVMRTTDEGLEAFWRRSRLFPWRKTLATRREVSRKHRTWIPLANEVARRVAGRIDGIPLASINEVVLDIPVTAHILGGCALGGDAQGAALDTDQRLRGHSNLIVCDGSAVPANPGVNPSLTITALTERAMAAVPAREDSDWPATTG